MTGVQTFSQLCCLGHYLTDATEGIHGCTNTADSTTDVAIQGIVSFVESTLDVLGMLHGLALLLQLFLFTFRQTGIGQLVVLELQEVQVLAVALDVVLQLLQLALGC